MTTDHKPENWFHEAGSDHCPHGAEPDRTSHDWNTWAEHHTGSPQDISICLEAPIGPCCPVCSEEFDEPVSWEHCTQRTTAAVTPAVTEDSHEQKVAEYLSTPYTDDTPSPTAVPVCICGHPEQRHLEDACQACGCGDYLEPQDAAEVIDRWRQEALKKRDDRRAAVLREAADALGRMDYDADSNDYGYDTYRDAWNGGVMDGAGELRRLADEAQQPAPAVTEEPGR